jgi:hypothetical protein
VEQRRGLSRARMAEQEQPAVGLLESLEDAREALLVLGIVIPPGRLHRGRVMINAEIEEARMVKRRLEPAGDVRGHIFQKVRPQPVVRIEAGGRGLPGCRLRLAFGMASVRFGRNPEQQAGHRQAEQQREAPSRQREVLGEPPARLPSERCQDARGRQYLLEREGRQRVADKVGGPFQEAHRRRRARSGFVHRLNLPCGAAIVESN